MQSIVLKFDNGSNLTINLDKNNFVTRWLDLFSQEIKTKPILQIDTFSNFYTEQESLGYLKSAIKTVNRFLRRDFVEMPPDILDREYFNRLHVQFEKLAGPDWEHPTRLMCLAPADIKLAIKHVNRFCHRLETQPYQLIPQLRVEFDTDFRLLLEDQDYKLFEIDYKKNKVYLDYSTLGKSLYECFVDGLPPTYSGMKMQQHYCANFLMFFEKPQIKVGEFTNWLDKHNISSNIQRHGMMPLGNIAGEVELHKVIECRKITNIILE